MKHILLTISLILGATAVSADEKVWALNVTVIPIPLNIGINKPTSGGFNFLIYNDIEKCRAKLQNYVLRNSTDPQVELSHNDTFDPLSPNAVLYYSSIDRLKFVECSPKILQD